MPKRFPPGPCVHCLQYVQHPTSDHVFPKSWYPDSTPQNIEKWQIPSCSRCNEDYGRLEEKLLLKLAQGVDNDAVESLGVANKLLRAVNPSRGRDSVDASIRERELRSVLLSRHPPSGKNPVVCMTGHPSGFVVDLYFHDIERLVHKIIRGLIFMNLGRLVSQEYEIGSKPSLGEYPDFDGPVVSYGEPLACGPGIEVRWLKVPEDPVCGIFMIRFFGLFPIRGWVLRKVAKQEANA
jgi:hypothetical protein